MKASGSSSSLYSESSSSSSGLPPSYKNNYCFYKKEIERELSKNEILEQNRGEEIEARLDIEYTDLDAKEEKNLRKYILHKANRNLIYPNGQIGILPTFVSKSKISGTTICYYSLIEITSFSPNSSYTSFEDKGEDSAVVPQKQEYIVCLICEVENDEGFALFRPDLGLFCEKLQSLLSDSKLHGKSAEPLKDHLSSWYTYTIEYITRCVDIIKDRLAVILHAAMLGKTIFIKRQQMGQTMVDDLTKFIQSLSLSSPTPESTVENQVSSTVIVINEDEDHQILPDALVITIDSQYNLTTNLKETNVFCKELAKELRKLPRDPLKLRNLLEQQKLKVIQELNQLRRLIDQAKLNNYALYKSYRLLKQNNNSDVLLTLLLQDGGDPHFTEVLEVIQKCLTSSGA